MGGTRKNAAKYADALAFPRLILDNGRIYLSDTREQFFAKGSRHWDGTGDYQR